MTRRWMSVVALAAAFALVVAACGDDDATTTSATEAPTTTAAATTTEAAEPLTFGMILVGPENDRGWSQAHFEAGQYLEDTLGATMISLDKVNTADRPDTTVEQVIDDMVADGATLIFATSDDMRDGASIGAANNPDIPIIWSSGDSAWADGRAFNPAPNLGNTMGRMYYAKFMAGCAAALMTQTGSIGYLGPLINDETRRLANSAYLGAKYCYSEYRGMTDELTFTVNWIGFWFSIPGFTLDPTQVANDFFDGGADVVISGIDTTEALVVAGQRAAGGETVWAIPYDYKDACAEAAGICLGVPYFNWGPAYKRIVESVIAGTYTAQWEWFGPNWDDLNDPETSGVGFVKGDGLSEEASGFLDEFIDGLASGAIDLYVGPLNYQDGSVYLGDGEKATDQQLWYTEQLLEGMIGASSAS
ncbi:MAG: BMP family ABC transporter substrate-binding protein [Actinobacteria bacterium]|nr:BMP family ABC transporter substrate-binding protein [Actinomycetota bacterium]